MAKCGLQVQAAEASELHTRECDATAVIQSLSRRQKLPELSMQALLRADVGARLAAVLLDLAQVGGRHRSQGNEIDLRLTHQELSELSGVSRPLVTATLNQWRRRDLLCYTREYICIERHEQFRELIA